MVTLLYNDRINTHREMVEIDAGLDNSPTNTKVAKLAELRIRNFEAFAELKSLNDKGKFLYKHYLVAHQSLRSQLAEQLKNNSNQFLDDYANCRDNVKRYSSYLNSKTRSAKQKQKDRENLKKHQDKETVYKEVLSNQK